MIPESILRTLCQTTPSKIVLLVMDGIGGAPVNGRTELEAARTPHLDCLAVKSEGGLTDPIGRGITPAADRRTWHSSAMTRSNMRSAAACSRRSASGWR